MTIIPAETLLAILHAHPDGLTEHDLIRQLSNNDPCYCTDAYTDKLSLFQCHFILYHHLYRLRDNLWNARQADLSIHCLKIVLNPFPNSIDHLPAIPDPMRGYYLDLSQLEETGQNDVLDLLDAFWLRFTRHERRTEALAALGLSDPVDDPAIKRRYQELAMEHHPDRGGQLERLQIINAAMELLKPFRVQY